MGDFRDANVGPGMARIQHAAARLFDRAPGFALRVRNAGEVADFTAWTRETFGDVRLSRGREALWGVMAEQVKPDWTGIELGVAWGYASDWWLRKTEVGGWHGFDRFTGLPRAWHGEAEGAYSADGAPPPIDDPRVTWHVGDVEDTLPRLDLPPGPRLVLFDLDIYEPTVFAWQHLAPSLRPGDLLYFDEAMARDERRVLDELVIPSGVDYIGSTPTALALVVR